MEVLEGIWLRVDEFIDVDDEYLVVALTFGGKARHTGIDVELSPVHVFRLRDGRVMRWQIFQSRAEASKPPGCRSGRCRRTSGSCVRCMVAHD
jgi:hypothetical protein